MNNMIDEFRYKQYLNEMSNCKHEWNHEDADIILARFVEELGYTELVALYEKCPKWFA